MGIYFDNAVLVARTLAKLNIQGKLLELGRQIVGIDDQQLLEILLQVGLAKRAGTEIAFTHDVSGIVEANDYFRRDCVWTTCINDKVFFGLLGLNASSCDINDYEGADYIIDLNKDVDESYHGEFDVVYNGGTIEHVFDVLGALANCHRMLKVGGLMIHVAPANGFMDHGFFQFSPAFFHEYFPVNGYTVIESKLMIRDGKDSFVSEYGLHPDCSKHEKVLHYFVARKDKEWAGHSVPMQKLCADLWANYKSHRDGLPEYRRSVLMGKIVTDEDIKSVAIWCYGGFTRDLLKKYPGILRKTVCIVDKDPRKHGEFHEGVEIVSPQRCMDELDRFDAILLSTPDSMSVYRELHMVEGIKSRLYLL